MKEITLQVYLEALKKADPRTQELMRSEKLYEVIKSKAESINAELLILPIGYHLLNLLSLEEILLELTNLGINDQFNFLQEVKKKLMESQNDIKAEIAETEAALKTLPTMTDTQAASRTEVYPSQQADILGAKNTTPSNSPRWGSES